MDFVPRATGYWKDLPDKSTPAYAADYERYERGIAEGITKAEAATGGSVGSAYPQSVLVATGTEARPTGSLVVFWIDPRDNATRPDNMDPSNDVWLTQNGTAPSGDTTPPSVPTGLASSAITSTGFTVTWSASTDNVGVTGYQIRLASGTPISVSGTTYSFTGLTASTAYAVSVRARDAAGNWSAYSSALAVTTSGVGGDTTAPTVPGGLASSAVTSSGFTVSWTASTDAVGVVGYEVFLDGVSYATPTATTQAVTGRTASTDYSVTVRARDAAGNWSAQSSALVVTTAAAAPTLLSRFNFDEGGGVTANSVSGGFTMADMTGGSPVWGTGVIKTQFRGYVIGTVGAALTQWSAALDFTMPTAPGAEQSFWFKDGSTQTYFNITPGRAVKLYGVATSTSTALVSAAAPHRLVVTQDLTTVKLYLDAVEIISAVEHRDFERTLNSLNMQTTWDIDTFRVWDGALSAGQVSALGA